MFASLIYSLSITFMFMKTPMTMGAILMATTLNMVMIMGMNMQTFFFSYIAVIMMMSGLMILFMYMSVIASNNKFNSSITLAIMFILITVISWNVSSPNTIKINTSEPIMLNNMTMNWPTTLTAILMLLIVMIVVVTMVTTNKGPLRMSPK
uniref:NADH dehydrogenase subunit 6 n=1 Tax=Neuroctenus parus TaxID=498951 RepID=B7SMH6_9HEMI|nr:NADH dehydrogenase subunit 6 [Neuroctenus parus]ABZ02070.1 NADH dehydrogenase subunit 6 [Neuroctenus parus]